MKNNLLFASLMTFAFAMPAMAQSNISEKNLTRLGNWEIIATSINGQHFYCAAETNNRQVSLRIAMRDGRWQMGVPFYSKGKPTGSLTLPQSQEEILSFTADGDGWAHVEATSFLPTLKQGQLVSITLDRGPQTWSLAGSAAALSKVEECDRNRGRINAAQMPKQFNNRNNAQPLWGQKQMAKRPTPLTPNSGAATWGQKQGAKRPTPLMPNSGATNWGQKQGAKRPMPLMPNTGTANRGQFQNHGQIQNRVQANNADVPPGKEQPYLNNLKGWKIIRGRMDDRTPYCLAEKNFGHSALRLLFDKRDWLVGVRHRANGRFPGGIAVDGRSDGTEWLGLPSGWSVALVAEAFMTQDVARGRSLSATLSGRNYSYQLSGSAAAIGKIRECTSRMR